MRSALPSAITLLGVLLLHSPCLSAAAVAFIATNPGSAANAENRNALTNALTPMGHTWSSTNLTAGLSLNLASLQSFHAVYIDTRSTSQAATRSFLSASNRSILEAYVAGGGRLFLNVANAIGATPIPLLFGVSATDNSGTTAGVANGRQGVVTTAIPSGNGVASIAAGTTYSALGANQNALNNQFAPNYLTGTSLDASLIVDNATTSRTQLGTLSNGSGVVWFGTLNRIQRQTPLASARLLRQNIISTLAAPEPMAIALLALGLVMLASKALYHRKANHVA